MEKGDKFLRINFSKVFFILSWTFLWQGSQGCTHLREYLCVERGFLSLRAKKMFGPGIEVKEYYLTRNGELINLYDSQQEVFSKLGPPQKRRYLLEGCEVWFYEKEKVTFYFDNCGQLVRITDYE